MRYLYNQLVTNTNNNFCPTDVHPACCGAAGHEVDCPNIPAPAAKKAPAPEAPADDFFDDMDVDYSYLINA